ncbi:MAG: hypothetical protein ACFFBW_00330 [Promethearchaeota archaeon]
MVYFQVSRIGFNCGREKENCSSYPDHCRECITSYFVNVGIDVSQHMKFSEIDSEEKRIQMQQTLIWHKFLDVLNIKHIILLTKESGLLIVDYPVSSEGLNIELLIGFIQANISFSTSKTSLETGAIRGDTGNAKSSAMKKHKFYEFQYETFDILLKSGNYIRVCLVLDQKASPGLKDRVSKFLHEYELSYQKKIEDLLTNGLHNFNDTVHFIIEAFNIKLLFPMILTYTLLPSDLDEINKNPIQKAIIDFANELLISKKFFFIHNLLNRVQSVLNSKPHIILYEIYQFLEKNIIIPSNLEVVENEVRIFQEVRAKRIADNELISPIIANDDAINDLKEKVRTMNVEEAKKLMNTYIKKGETAEKALVFKEAQKEYEKALYLATGFNLELEIGRISFMVLELDKKIKTLEISNALEMGEKAEKRKDYVNAIQHFQQAIAYLSDNGLINVNGNEAKVRKLKKRILSLQKQL